MVRTIQEIIHEAFNEVPTITPEKAKEEQDNGAVSYTHLRAHET